MAQLRDYFVEADVEHLDALRREGASPLPKLMYKMAVKFAAEYRLGLWVRSVNIQRGASVRTAVLIDTYNRDAALLGNDGHLLPIKGVEYSTGRAWACRWRKRQRASYTSLRNLEALTTEQKERKARACSCVRSRSGYVW